MKDGWHVICGCDVYVEDGRIIRAKILGKAAWMYRKCKDGGWDCEESISVSAFRSGFNRGTIMISN